MNITDAFFVEYPGHLFSNTTKGMGTEAVKLRNDKTEPQNIIKANILYDSCTIFQVFWSFCEKQTDR